MNLLKKVKAFFKEEPIRAKAPPIYRLADEERFAPYVRHPIPMGENFQRLIVRHVDDIKHDYVSGARSMADKALRFLIELVSAAIRDCHNGAELYKVARRSVVTLRNARPAMSSAISSACIRALDECAHRIQIPQDKMVSTERVHFSYYSHLLISTLQEILARRKREFENMGKHFARWLDIEDEEDIKGRQYINILTLSNSSSVKNVIIAILDYFPELHINVTILESRPRFEGADFGYTLINAATEPKHLHIKIAPDAAVASVAKNIDFVFLGADRISHNGDVSNKIGSLAAVICGQSQSPRARVVCCTDTDKIAPPSAPHVDEVHEKEELAGSWNEVTVQKLMDEYTVFGSWFEWVRAYDVDICCSEKGFLQPEKIAQIAAELEEFEQAYARSEAADKKREAEKK